MIKLAASVSPVYSQKNNYFPDLKYCPRIEKKIRFMSQDALDRKLSGTWRMSLEAAVTSLVPNLAIRAVAFGRGSEISYLAAKSNVEQTEGLLFRGGKKPHP